MSEIPSVPNRPLDAHKGTFGTCLLVGGSGGMTGAVVLAARAALRSGVGLVRVAVPASRQPILPVAVPEATSLGMPERDGALALASAEGILEAARRAQAVGVGPGLSLAGEVRPLVARLVEGIAQPLVLDADALNAIAPRLDLVAARRSPTVLTPHPGEAARLLGLAGGSAVQQDRPGAARRLAEGTGATIVLKGAGTLVVEGSALYRNETGNAGMATGGSGDVLTGMVTALLAQGMAPFAAAVLAVHAHGSAGDAAARAGSQAGLIAGDLIRALPGVWRRLGGA